MPLHSQSQTTYLLLHTYTHVVFADIAIPVGDLGGSDDPDVSGEQVNAFEALPNKITIGTLIPHEDEVNKAR